MEHLKHAIDDNMISYMFQSRDDLSYDEWFETWEETLKVYAKNPDNEFSMYQAEALYMDCI